MSRQIASTKPNKVYAGGRLFYLDLIRTIACASVLMAHLCSKFVERDISNPDFWIGNFFDSFSRAAIALFVMITGALMLDENYVLTRKKLTGHILKMARVYVFWSVYYAIMHEVVAHLIQGEEFVLSRFLWDLINGHFHLWFIPMQIGLYLVMPLLRLWVNKKNRQYVEYFLILALVFSFVMPQCIKLMVHINPALDPIHRFADHFYMSYPCGYVAYLLLGWYLHNFEISRKKLFYGLGLVSVCCTFAGTYLLRAITGSMDLVLYDTFSVFVLFYAIAVFILAKSAFFQNDRPVSSLLRRPVSLISKHGFGIYLVHVETIAALWIIMPNTGALLTLPLGFLLCMTGSIIGAVVLSKLPFFKKFV